MKRGKLGRWFILSNTKVLWMNLASCRKQLYRRNGGHNWSKCTFQYINWEVWHGIKANLLTGKTRMRCACARV